MFKKNKKYEGFTLIELVIVIAIIAILIAIALPRYQQSNLSAQATSHNANVRVLKNSAMLYLVDHPEDTGEITKEKLQPYLENDNYPTPAKALKQDHFTVTATENGDITVQPGEVVVKDKKLEIKNSANKE